MVLRVAVSPPAANGTRTARILPPAANLGSGSSSFDASPLAAATACSSSSSPSCSFVLLPTETSLTVRALVDRSVVEFFVAGGRAVLTERAYPLPGEAGVELAADADAVVERAAVHEMGCGWAA